MSTCWTSNVNFVKIQSFIYFFNILRSGVSGNYSIVLLPELDACAKFQVKRMENQMYVKLDIGVRYLLLVHS